MDNLSDIRFAPLTKDAILLTPTTTGVYIFRNKKELLYIGKSNNIKARLLTHWESARLDTKEKAIIEGSEAVGFILTDSEFSALMLESKLIQRYKPRYNSRWRDDKSYLYIKITKDPYPKIYPVRKENDGTSLYFGPFSSQRSVVSLLRQIRKIFPFCAQKKSTKRGCFYSKIGLCNPCPSVIERLTTPKLRQKERARYRKNVRNIIKVLQGNTDLVLKDLYRSLARMTRQERYEDAILARNQIYAFERLVSQRTFSTEEVNYNRSGESLSSLRTLLRPYFPNLSSLRRIECYDISNFGGKDSASSMVVFTEGLIDRSQYRRFRIKNASLTSDFEMLQETLERRFRRKTWAQPDLIVIDGGKPQLLAVKKTMEDKKLTLPFIGIAKHPDRLIVGAKGFPLLRPPFHHLGFNLVRHIRDESHRFARKYHRYLRNKKILPL